MKTYQDLIEAQGKNINILQWVFSTISQFEGDKLHKRAVLAEKYYYAENTGINEYCKWYFDVLSNSMQKQQQMQNEHHIVSNFFQIFVKQEANTLLGNGVSFGNEATKGKLGKDFDERILETAIKAISQGVCFVFYNLDHIEVFPIYSETGGFIPLADEEDGQYKAGIRYWRISPDKPLRATLYEIDGYTEMIRRENKEPEFLSDKKPYKTTIRGDRKDMAEGTEIREWQNYKSFPIVPLKGNNAMRSALLPLKDSIDAYDIIKSGFANDTSEVQVYWTCKNCGAMTDKDFAKIQDRLRLMHWANLPNADEGATIEPNTLDIPFTARQAALEKIERDLYRDAMALDTSAMAGASMAIPQIEAAYEKFNTKLDEFEMCVTNAINAILNIAGIDDVPTYHRSIIINKIEEANLAMAMAEYIGAEEVTRRLCAITGDIDRTNEILDAVRDEEAERMIEDV